MIMAICILCGDTYPDERKVLGYRVCLECGIDLAKAESIRKQSMVQPINKSTPTYIADFTLLKQLNPKRTT
jgi:predicted  nucleic acid-binding Zn-ribbon protein